MSTPRSLLLAALTIAMAAPALASTAAAPSARDLNFTIRNQSSYAVSELYMSGCDVIQWRALPLQRGAFPDGLVHPGQSVVYALNPGCVNLRLVTLEGYEFYYGIEVTAYDVYEWELYDDMISDPGYDSGADFDEMEYGYVEFINDNGYENVKDVFFRSCGTEWGSDYLGGGEFIQVDEPRSFELPAGCWDAAIRLTSEQVMNWRDLNVQGGQAMRLRVPTSH